MSFDLTNKNIQDTFQNLLQKTGSEGKLFDLVGNEIIDLTIGGTLTAHSYITSESIVNTSSGSTAFGNSSDDSHTFQGHITASGEISASGNIFAKSIYFGSTPAGSQNYVAVSGDDLFIGADDDLILQPDDDLVIQAGATTKHTFFAEGRARFNSVNTEAPDATLEIQGDLELKNPGHITASGNISASATSTGSFGVLELPDNGEIVLGNGGDLKIFHRPGTFSRIQEGGDGPLQFSSNRYKFMAADNSSFMIDATSGGAVDLYHNNNKKLETTIGGINVTGHITASGNISASGDMFAHSGSFNYITASVLDLDGQTLRIGGEEFTKANIQTLKQGRTLKPLRVGKARPDFEAEDGRFDGDITASGDILNTRTIQMTNSSSVINTFNTDSHQTCKYVLQVTSGSHIQSSEMLVMVSASSAVNTEYAQINSGLNLLDFSSNINGSNVELIGSSSFISCSVKLNRKLI